MKILPCRSFFYFVRMFFGLKVQNEELARDLACGDADMEELANFVSTMNEVIKSMERRILQVKKGSADLKAEVQSLHSLNDLQETDHQQQTSQ